MTVEQLYQECAKQIADGNGQRHVLTSNDDEGNGYHELFSGFEVVDFTKSWAMGLQPFGISEKEASKDYITLG